MWILVAFKKLLFAILLGSSQQYSFKDVRMVFTIKVGYVRRTGKEGRG